MDESKFLEGAIEEVKQMLLRKKDIWTTGQGPFQNFDVHEDFDVDPIQFALVMCNLKMNRLKSCWNQQFLPHAGPLYKNTDARDSLIDVAAYAILGLALMDRAEHGEKKKEPREWKTEVVG